MSGDRAARDVAWLVFGPHKADRRGRAGWLTRQPIGVQVLDEVLRGAGREVGVCSPATAHRSRVVLVSLTSPQDVLAFRRAVAGAPGWDAPRDFRVVAGGYGMQNAAAVRDLVDYAFFGRAETEIAAVVDAAEDRRPSDCDAVMHLPDLARVTVRQPVTLYDGLVYRETFTGCPLACKFCHYTFARKHLGGDHAYSRTETTAGSYVEATEFTQSTSHGGGPNHGGAEVTWPQLIEWPHDRTYRQVIVGLDGPSERLRWLYGKRISRAEVVSGLDNIARVRAADGAKLLRLKVYDIRFPAEAAADRAELAATLAEASPPAGFCLQVQIHVTPFQPSAWTPMQWEPFEMRDCRRLAGSEIHVWGGSGLPAAGELTAKRSVAWYDRYIASPRSQIEEAAVLRHDGSPEAEAAIELVASRRWRRLRAPEAAAAARRAHPWLDRFGLARLEVGEAIPTQLARAVADVSTLERIAARMREDVAASEADAAFRRGKRTVMGRTLIPVSAEVTV